MKLSFLPDFKSFYANARHVINISYKPNVQHFSKTLKIVLVGTLIVGVMGYIISFIVEHLI
ncbi:MAG: protein translocase SEC61 complex subunit gamma [Candidatus Micrarchaeota archaeon]|nr:protein translocase SEC61 complex subunit gamma [Candidatus Micrarchaeota archaeon]